MPCPDPCQALPSIKNRHHLHTRARRGESGHNLAACLNPNLNTVRDYLRPFTHLFYLPNVEELPRAYTWLLWTCCNVISSSLRELNKQRRKDTLKLKKLAIPGVNWKNTLNKPANLQFFLYNFEEATGWIKTLRGIRTLFIYRTVSKEGGEVCSTVA